MSRSGGKRGQRRKVSAIADGVRGEAHPARGARRLGMLKAGRGVMGASRRVKRDREMGKERREGEDVVRLGWSGCRETHLLRVTSARGRSSWWMIQGEGPESSGKSRSLMYLIPLLTQSFPAPGLAVKQKFRSTHKFRDPGYKSGSAVTVNTNTTSLDHSTRCTSRHAGEQLTRPREWS